MHDTAGGPSGHNWTDDSGRHPAGGRVSEAGVLVAAEAARCVAEKNHPFAPRGIIPPSASQIKGPPTSLGHPRSRRRLPEEC